LQEIAGRARFSTAGREQQAGAVVLRDVDVRYGDVQATTGLSLAVRPGEFVSLIGPSGCGKSSALRAIGGLMAPTAGEIELAGRPVTGPRPDDIAYVFQDLALFPWRSVRRNVEIALELARAPKGERRERADAALATVGLSDVAERFPAQLSGGMRQRVALARALVSAAPVLLFDEPFAALDEHARMLMGMELLRLIEHHGKTVVFVTHSLSEAAYLSDRVVVLSHRPATVREIVEIDLPRPRTPDLMRSERFHELSDRLFSLLFDRPAA
jgi:NitT/TauT family transport system ATP-binding protein